MIYPKGTLTILLGIFGFLLSKEIIGFFLGVIVGFIIEFKLLILLFVNPYLILRKNPKSPSTNN
jgi:hypothetical protein